jgi:hypothetical protein
MAGPSTPDAWLSILTEDTRLKVSTPEVDKKRGRVDKHPSGVGKQPSEVEKQPSEVEEQPSEVEEQPLNVESEPGMSLKRCVPECLEERERRLKREASEAEFQRLLALVE